MRYEFLGAINRIAVFVFEKMLYQRSFDVFAVLYVFKRIFGGRRFKRSFRTLYFYVVIRKSVRRIHFDIDKRFIRRSHENFNVIFGVAAG